MTKQMIYTTDLFKGKQIPQVIAQHPLFRNPEEIKKIFPSIGLSNFKEKANIEKCLIDVKKPNTYVFNLLRAISDAAVNAARITYQVAEQKRYLGTMEERKSSLSMFNKIYALSSAWKLLGELTNPADPNVLEHCIIITNGKIELKLHHDICDAVGNVMFKKGVGIFKVYGKCLEQSEEMKIQIANLASFPEFKIFSKENIVNKEYQVIFSSDGEEGAWDLLTMSMRGIKSCQRWGGDYPRCLVGSIISKFVGIIYLTSGVMADPIEEWNSLGTKMLRRCMVRYVFDRDEEGPCLILDKMYPEFDKDIYNLFVSNINSKCKLPVHYGPDLTTKLKHIYIPNEELNTKISARDKSYQDTPLRSKQDLDVQLVKQNQLEIERYTNTFNNNLAVFLASKFDDIANNNISSSDAELKKILNNIKMNITLTVFSQLIVVGFMSGFIPPSSSKYYDSRAYYKEYLTELFKQILSKKMIPNASVCIQNTIAQSSSRTIDTDIFINHITPFILQFTKSQIINPIFKGI